MKKLLLFSLLFFTAQHISAQHNFNVDFSQTAGTLKDLIEVNKGDMSVFGEGYSDAGISYVRMHDFYGANDYCYYTDFWIYDEAADEFTEINPDFDPVDPAYYNWTEFDETLSGFNDFNLQAYIRFGTSYPNPEYTLQPMEPPLDPDGLHFTKFAELCKRTVMHFNEGWDDGYFYNVKYWEFWNEPGGLFWNGTPMQFYKAYEATAQLLKTEFPDIKIGAPGAVPLTALGLDPTYGVNFLDYIRDKNLPLDFYSWHVYALMNPFALDGIAGNIRSWLDERDFTETESHLTEINHSLDDFGFGYFDTNAKGTAYYSSLVITAQKSSIDKLFWYPGKVFFEEDGVTYTYVGYGAKSFSLMKYNAPEQLLSSGDVVIEGNNDADTTNVMLLASKSADSSKVYLLLSNYNSDFNRFTISIENLPWTSSDSIKCVKNTTKNPGIKFAESVETLTGGNTMTINVDGLPSPTTVLIRLEKIESPTSVIADNSLPEEFELFQNYPNPFGKSSAAGNSFTTIKYSIPNVGNANPASPTNVQLKIYDALGREVATLVNKKQPPGNYEAKFNASGLPSGVYFYRLQSGANAQTKKMILLR